MVRKTVFFLITVVAVWIARGIWDWNPSLRGRIGDHPWQSVGHLALGVASVALLVWGIVRPSSWKVLLAFGLGVLAALWGKELLEGIGWMQVGVFAGCIALLVALWAFTVLDGDHAVITRARTRLAPTTTPTGTTY